jgi:HSP20 family protein
MSNPIVRRTGGEQPRSPTEGEAIHWMHWDPFRQMAPFLTGEEHAAHYVPDFEVKESKDGFIFKADVPGILEKNLEITMTGNRLTISGTREAEKAESSDSYFVRECAYGSFTRAFTLPEGTDSNNEIRAELSQGVLTLFLPKRPELQPRRIEVKVAEKPKS